MTPQEQGQDLSSAQRRALDLLLLGRSDAEVGEELGRNRSTIWRWRTTNQRFRTELEERRLDLSRALNDRIRALAAEALDVIADEIRGRSPKAAVDLLRLSLRPVSIADPQPLLEAEREKAREQVRSLARAVQEIAPEQMWERIRARASSIDGSDDVDG